MVIIREGQMSAGSCRAHDQQVTLKISPFSPVVSLHIFFCKQELALKPGTTNNEWAITDDSSSLHWHGANRRASMRLRQSARSAGSFDLNQRFTKIAFRLLLNFFRMRYGKPYCGFADAHGAR